MKDLTPRYSGLVIGLLLLMFSPAAFCEYNVTMTLQYDAYETDDDSIEITGVEMSVPLELAYTSDQLTVKLSAAYADANVSQDGSADATLSGLTDTTVNAIYTYPFSDNLTKVLLYLDLNLPTGEERLDAEQAVAESQLRGDGDLFRVDDFGEGLNVGATIGVERQFGANTVGVYGGYTYYGEYDPSAGDIVDEYDPGDEIFAGVLFERKSNLQNSLQAYVGYSYFSVDTVNQEDAIRIGSKLSAGVDLQASLLENIEMALLLQYIYQFASEDAIRGDLVEEPENSNGDELLGSLGFTYHVDPRFSVQLVSELRYYGESDRKREDAALPYESRYTRYSIGPGFEYRMTPSIALRGFGSYFYLDRDADTTFAESRAFQGMNLDFGAKYTF